MSNKNEEAAFPQVKFYHSDDHSTHPMTGGLTKREYFATNAPDQVFNVEFGSVERAAEFIGIDVNEFNYIDHWPKAMAKLAVNYADALLEELDKCKVE